MARLAIDADFMDDFSKLEKSVQALVMTTIKKFAEHTHAGIHLEKVQHSKDDRIRTIRVDQFWRGVVFARPGKDGTVTTTARRCAACGYLHAEVVGIDNCENDGCGQLLGKTTRDLLRLTTVRTQRRDRISSDEEERRRAGFELQTAYRFAQHGTKPGRIDATVTSDDRADILTLSYGDSATIRKTNVGRRRRVNAEVQGYLIDVTTGRWLKENEKDEAIEWPSAWTVSGSCD